MGRGTYLPGTLLAPHDDRFRHEKPAGTVAPAVPAGSYLSRDTRSVPGAQHIGKRQPDAASGATDAPGAVRARAAR